ncbi:glycosyltransferase [Rhodobacteraceae bacterium KMM 6894]|nr:glycosyltransferase [Rhodobacteraceae bacterium KMM 6894]
MSGSRVDAVVIGRNEGARLIACLASLRGKVGRIIYVDSGSTDDSVAAARAAGAEVVELDMDRPFTAARARNAGLARLEGGEFVQLLDGDCTVQPGWISDASAYLSTRPGLAVVCGRRREIAPEASVYNRLIDREWDTPIGSAKACGGDAMMRLEALRDVGGYDDSLIAGEEPDLCLRLRAAGWGIWRLDDEMTLHDAGLTRFSQWWRRARRAGHAFAEGAARHGAGPEQHWVVETRRALLWGAVLPGVIVLAALLHPAALALALIYPAQVIRLARISDDWQWALFTQLGKFAEAQGALGYYLHRLRGRKQRLIEYK